MTDDNVSPPATGTRWKLTQETIAIITVGLTLGTLIIYTASDIRAEARADREAFYSEMRAMRAEAQADRQANAEERRRFEERMDRDRRRFENEILRLTKGQERLVAIVESQPQQQSP